MRVYITYCIFTIGLVSIRAQLCPLPKLPAPPPGCFYDTTKGPDGCPSYQLICEDAETPECPPNSVFKQCGTACPKTCDNFRNTMMMCTMQCVAECQCVDGFVLDANGRCIPADECPGSVCPLPAPAPPPPGCSYETTTGPDGCPNYQLVCKDAETPGCPPNSVFKGCGTACPKTCDNFQNPLPCTMQCVAECQCVDGFVLDANGRCIPTDECPGSGKDCPLLAMPMPLPGCTPRQVTGPDGCPTYTFDCEPATSSCAATLCPECHDCQEINGNARCIRISNCIPPSETPECPPNSVFKQCGTACPKTCDNFQNTFMMCTEQCVAECQCVDGFVLDSNGRCIPTDECPGSGTVDKCATVRCARCTKCRNGRCVPDPRQPGCSLKEDACATVRCARCFTCRNGRCVPDPRQPGCSLKEDACATIDCAPCFTCRNGRCVPDRKQRGCLTPVPDEQCPPVAMPMVLPGCTVRKVTGPDGCPTYTIDCEPAPSTCASTLCPVCHKCREVDGVAKCVRVPNCCEKNVNPVRCFADPCQTTQRCPGVEHCVADYCGGCNANFYDSQWNPVKCNIKSDHDPCSSSPCKPLCERCVPEPKMCITTPCPQYRCENTCDDA